MGQACNLCVVVNTSEVQWSAISIDDFCIADEGGQYDERIAMPGLTILRYSGVYLYMTGDAICYAAYNSGTDLKQHLRASAPNDLLQAA